MPQARRKSRTDKQKEGSPRLQQLGSETVVFFSLAAALYAFLSLISYSATDPGWSHSGESGSVANWGGKFGAYFADLLLHGFGYMCYMVPVMMIALGVRLYRGRNSNALPSYGKRMTIVLGCVMAVVGGCGLENLHFYQFAVDQPFEAGGYLGDGINTLLLGSFGWIGASLILLTLFLTGVTFFSGLSWFSVMDALGAKFFQLLDQVSSMREAKADRAIGSEARKVRESSVSELRKKFAKKKPPRIEPRIKKEKQSPRVTREKQPTLFDNLQSDSTTLPPLSLLEAPEKVEQGFSDAELETMSRLLEKKLADFNVEIEVVAVHPGPVITRFEVEPAPGVKASQIVGLSRDLARAMSVISVRVVENIPGKAVIGIEIPNEAREIVRLMEGLSSKDYDGANTPLALVLGKDISGATVIVDLCKMPHVLIAGTTGSGKSVCINALILSMLYKSSAREVRMIMIDPKMLELSVYDGIPHLLAPVVTDMSEAANALRWSIVEMEQRYKLMSELGVRNIAGFNRKVKAAADKGEPILDPLAREGEAPEPLEELPFIVVIIDELADLMMVVGKKVEVLITRLAQKGRASGVHLVLATQRPSVDVITGLIKANIPTRIAFQVSSRVDSRTVLDQMGAEQLLGHGDMLYLPPGTSLPERVHGSFVSDQEVHSVVEFLKKGTETDYREEVITGPKDTDLLLPSALMGDGDGDDAESDPLYDQAIDIVLRSRRASISSVQRQLRVGYNRAARMIETMEASGVVGPLESNGKREVLAPAPGGEE
jgi:S-DNA-T family DNA segregation ATPase FtsK/SpoIIIE